MTEIVVKPRGGGRVEVFLNGKFVGIADIRIDGSYRGIIRLKKVM